MKKVGVFFFIILIAPLLAGIYGILHDQFTVTISEEYFTKFKFYQFGILDLYHGTESSKRMLTAYVGWSATWWTGIPIGMILGTAGLMQTDWKDMWTITLKSLLLVIGITLLTGFIGLAYGYFFLADSNVDWYFPENLIDKKRFIMVGSMHNFSYLGGLIGLIGAVIFQVKEKRKRSAHNL